MNIANCFENFLRKKKKNVGKPPKMLFENAL